MNNEEKDTIKKTFLILVTVSTLLLLAVALVSCGQNLQPQVDKLTAENKILKELVGPPPASLDKLFPPQSPAPVFLLGMFDLASPFESIGIDLGQGDIAGAKANFDAFKEQYIKMSDMVPEWKDRFPMAPVDALGQALASGDPSKVGPAMGGVGQVCGDCHAVNQVKVVQKYHWKDFDEIKLTDPVTKTELDWTDYMMSMTLSFTGIGNDLQQGQLDNARKNYDNFSAQFKTLATEGCKQCHQDPTGKEIPRSYFVDKSVMDAVDQMGQALKATPPDGQTFGQVMGFLGNESCAKCHWVHVPAQMSKHLWENLPALLK